MLRAECRGIQRGFLALEEGRLDPAAAARVRGHVSVCPECRATWDAWQADDGRLREALRPSRAPRAVVESAMAAIRQPAPKLGGVRRVAVGWQVAMVAAAAVLVVSAAMILTDGRTRRVGQVAALTGQPVAQQRGARFASVLGVGAGIYEDCRLLTGRAEGVELSFEDGSRLVVMEGADVRLDCVGAGGTGHGLPHVCLSRGEVMCDLKSPRVFRGVGTPLGTILTTGGKLHVRYVPDIMLVVQLVEGVGRLSYEAGEMPLAPGAIWIVEPGTGRAWQAPGTIWGK